MRGPDFKWSREGTTQGRAARARVFSFALSCFWLAEFRLSRRREFRLISLVGIDPEWVFHFRGDAISAHTSGG